MTCLEALKKHLADVGVEPMPDLQESEKKAIYVRGLFFDFAIKADLIQEHESWQSIKVSYVGTRARAGEFIEASFKIG